MRVVVQWLPETGTVFVVVVFEGDWRLKSEYETAASPYEYWNQNFTRQSSDPLNFLGDQVFSEQART